MFILLVFQVLEYNVAAATWTEIGNLETARAFHAIAEVPCPVGNINPVNRNTQIS